MRRLWVHVHDKRRAFHWDFYKIDKSTEQTSVEKFLTLAASPWKRSLGRKPVVAYNSR